jgi:hypothetical protein
MFMRVTLLIVIVPLWLAAISPAATRPYDSDRRHHQQGRPEEARIVPPSWRLQPQDPRLGGRHYISADGQSRFAAYATPVRQEPVTSHMDALASGEDERVTYRRRERDWLAVSGFKGDRIFYRKAILACGGKVWHHIEFEYPASRKREMDAFVIRASHAIDQAENDNC